MATKQMAYDHSAYVARYSAPIYLPATAASTLVNKFVAFTNLKIKSINVGVIIAGTATGAAYDIFNGTSSVGQIVAGTGAIGSVLTALSQDITLAAGGYLDIKTAAASATLVGAATLEYEIIPGANVTV